MKINIEKMTRAADKAVAYECWHLNQKGHENDPLFCDACAKLREAGHIIKRI